MDLGSIIKDLRKKKGMKQSELANKAGISRVAVGNYERNERTPNAEILLKLATALDVSILDLMNLSADDYDLISDIAKKTKTHPAYITGKTKEKEFKKYYFESLIKDFNLERFKQIVSSYNEEFQKSIFLLWSDYLDNMLPECYYNDDIDSESNSNPDFVVGEELDKVYIVNMFSEYYEEFRGYLSYLTHEYFIKDGKLIDEERELEPSDMIEIYKHKEKMINNISILIDKAIKRFTALNIDNSPLYGLEIIERYGENKE